MDEFRKPYVYEEDKVHGMLQAYALLNVSLDLIVTIFVGAQGYIYISESPIWRYPYLVLWAIYAVSLLLTSITGYKGKASLLFFAKLFLVIRLVFGLVSLTLDHMGNLVNPNLIGTGIGQFETTQKMTMVLFVFPAVYFLVYSAAWFAYFTKSKKCALLVSRAKQAKNKS